MKAHYGTTPIPIPPTYTSPQQIGLLSRDIQKSIKALRDRPVIVHGGAKGGSASMLQFKARVFKEDETWKATIHPGYVIVTNPSSSGDALSRAVPVIDSVSLDAEVTPKLEVTADQWIYLRLQTDEKDQPTGLPEIVADVAEKESIHYQPPPASVSGDYYYPIARIGSTGEGDGLVLTIAEQYQQGGPIIHRPGLVELENVLADEGENYEVFKDRDTTADKYLFRALTQLPGSGIPILRPAPGDPAEPEDTIPVRRIRERATSPQVRVGKTSDVADAFVQIEGNGYNAALTGTIGQLQVTDGLVVAASLASGGYTGNIKIIWTFNPASGSSTVNVLSLTFDKGRLITVGMDAVDGTTDVTGTSNIEFFMTATDTTAAP
jgi:hypothetical protein